MYKLNVPNHNIRAFILLQVANAIDISMTFLAIVLKPEYLRYEMNGYFKASVAQLFIGNIIPIILAVIVKISIFLALGLIIVYRPFPDKFIRALMIVSAMYFFALMSSAGMEWFSLALLGEGVAAAIQDLSFVYIPTFMAFFWLNMQSERSDTLTKIP